MISIAIPTGGRLLDGSLELLDRAGAVCLRPDEIGRKLLVEKDGLRVVLVRPADVPFFVNYGAADLGFAGKDDLWESDGPHCELADLGFGACRLVVAVPEASGLRGPESWPPSLRVGTKHVRATAAYMAGLGQPVEIVGLRGSVELAPLVGLADAIVDVTETGRTLSENGLRIVAEVGRSSARLIANQAALSEGTPELHALIGSLRGAVGVPSPVAGGGDPALLDSPGES